jgi:hypothetical protein
MKSSLSGRNKSYYGGCVMLLIGLSAVLQGMQYPVGTPSSMGPGFFPVSLGVVLALIGLSIAISGKFEQTDGHKKQLPPEWRGWFCICASITAFVTLGKYGGLLPATFAIVFISALGDRQTKILEALQFAGAISVICVVVFWWALQLQLPLFSWG